MTNQQTTLRPFFEKGFIEKHAGKIILKPDFALVELVANSWDAGAKNVKIEVPEKEGGILSIEDNGTGMRKDDFENIWPVLSYNRVKHQGKKVIFPDDKNLNRNAFGRNGKGRHAMFCFADSYQVETWREGIGCIYSIKKAYGEEPFEIILIKDRIKKDLHGTKISTKLIRNLPNPDDVIELIGSKFIVDPTFQLFVNEKEVNFTDLEGLIEKFIVDTPYGNIEINLFDTKTSGRTTMQYGVAWWVNRRLVGTPSWGRIEGIYIDGRTSEAKRYTFVVMADILEDEVKKDWSGFLVSKKYNEILERVESNIISKLQVLFFSKRKERKKELIEKHRNVIKDLPLISRNKIGEFISEIQQQCPTLTVRDLNNLTKIMINLENSNTGYGLLSKISEISVDDIDTLYEILSEWTIQDAKIVLDELEKRLKLIDELQKWVELKCDGLHQLQPLFERGLWIFGPEYESIHFTSNRTLTNAIRNLFKKEPVEKSAKRPDFVILKDSTIQVYSSDNFNEEGEVSGTEKVLIIELKRGKFEISRKERSQALEYAAELLRLGQIQPTTKIVAYVLGYSISQDAIKELTEGDNIIVRPTAYLTILRKAHKRTYDLHKRIKKYKQIKEDDEIKDVLKQKSLDDKFENKKE